MDDLPNDLKIIIYRCVHQSLMEYISIDIRSRIAIQNNHTIIMWYEQHIGNRYYNISLRYLKQSSRNRKIGHLLKKQLIHDCRVILV